MSKKTIEQNATKTERKTPFSIMLDPSIRDEFRAYCKENNLNMSLVTRGLITNFLKRK